MATSASTSQRRAIRATDAFQAQVAQIAPTMPIFDVGNADRQTHRALDNARRSVTTRISTPPLYGG